MHVERIARGDEVTYLRFSGIVTDDPRNDLDSTLVSPSAYRSGTVLSLRDVTLLNSRGIGMLLKLNRAIKDAGGRLVLVDVPMSVRQVLSYMKLDDVLAIAGSEQEAEEMLR